MGALYEPVREGRVIQSCLRNKSFMRKETQTTHSFSKLCLRVTSELLYSCWWVVTMVEFWIWMILQILPTQDSWFMMFSVLSTHLLSLFEGNFFCLQLIHLKFTQSCWYLGCRCDSWCCSSYDQGCKAIRGWCLWMAEVVYFFSCGLQWSLCCSCFVCMVVVHRIPFSGDSLPFFGLPTNCFEQISRSLPHWCLWGGATHCGKSCSTCDLRWHPGCCWATLTLCRSDCWNRGCSPCCKITL